MLNIEENNLQNIYIQRCCHTPCLNPAINLSCRGAWKTMHLLRDISPPVYFRKINRAFGARDRPVPFLRNLTWSVRLTDQLPDFSLNVLYLRLVRRRSQQTARRSVSLTLFFPLLFGSQILTLSAV